MLFFDSVRNRLEEYNKYKFRTEIRTPWMKPYPVLVSPLIGFFIVGVVLNAFAMIAMISIKLHDQPLSVQKTVGLFSYLGTVALAFTFSMLWTALVIYPISRLRKHDNEGNFIFINYVIILAMMVGLFLILLPYGGVTFYYLPLMFGGIAYFNVLFYRAINSLYKRDEYGNMVYSKDSRHYQKQLEKQKTNKE